MTTTIQARHLAVGDRIYLHGADRTVTATTPGPGITVNITADHVTWTLLASRLVTITTRRTPPRKTPHDPTTHT